MNNKILNEARYFLGSHFCFEKRSQEKMWIPATSFQFHSVAFILCGYVGACLTDGLFHLFPLVLNLRSWSQLLVLNSQKWKLWDTTPFLVLIFSFGRVQELVQSMERASVGVHSDLAHN